MDILEQWLDNTNFPLLTAFILGLMTAISPCPLTTNITAIGFISKDLKKRKQVFLNGIWYTIGRIFTYTLIAAILFFGASTFHLARALQSNGEKFLGPLLIILGLLMLNVIQIPFLGKGKLTSKFEKNARGGTFISSLLLGMLFALAFCPYSGALYFGLLIPLTLGSSWGLLLPVVFAIATGLPVLIVAYLLAYSLSNLSVFFKKITTFELWFRRIVAVLFIIAGLYYVYLFFLQ